MSATERDDAYVLARIAVAENGCWNWTASRDRDGYGRSAGNRNRLAHRVAYEAFVGPVTPGLEVDHLCFNRACVNPAHLDAVTHGENVRRNVASRRHRFTSRTHCNNGHPFDEANTYWRRDCNGRRCIACRSEQARKKQVAC